MTLQEKIDTRTAGIAVIGTGYVGLPLALEFARAGLRVTGLDVDARKVEAIGQGRSYIADISARDIA